MLAACDPSCHSYKGHRSAWVAVDVEQERRGSVGPRGDGRALARAAARGTLDPRFGPVAQVFGEMKEFSCEESDDGMSLNGKCEYEDVAAAKSAVDKYDGQDMGLGTTLELESY